MSSQGVPKPVAGIPAPPVGWPSPLGKAAMHGLVGEFVDVVSPNSESDVAALAVGFLSAFGNAVGRGPHFNVESNRHGTNLFVVFVGDTSKSRKGTAMNYTLNLFERADPDWASTRVKGGLSSGEGVVTACSEGGKDHRVFFVEDEFASVLKMMSRHGNTLSTTLRRAWDSKALQISTKHSPLLVEEPHISLIGHTTAYDLRRYLDRAEIANGFCNRALWLCTRRSKLLPFGGEMSGKEFGRLANKTKRALAAAAKLNEVGISEKSRTLWNREYFRLTTVDQGAVGQVTGRGDAQVRRLAALYAAIDNSKDVRLHHLNAALEVWRYCSDSALFLFGTSEKRLAVRIQKMLRESRNGLTRSEISAALSRHVNGDEIREALESLKKSGVAVRRVISTAGRSAERWCSDGKGD
jgi:hypothetical protein